MVGQHSQDSDIVHAAEVALGVIDNVLDELPAADTFDYGGHIMKLGEYDVCEICTQPIAEAQAAHDALEMKAAHIEDPEVREHVELAAELFKTEAQAATIRAELHNGQGSEKIIDRLNGFLHDRNVHDTYEHSHNKGK